MTGAVDDPWLGPIDLMVDSDAPEQIAVDLGRRHALYLREAQRLVVDGRVPDEAGLAEGMRAETIRYLQSHPWAAHPTLEPAVAAADARALAALKEIVAAAPAPAPPSERPAAAGPAAGAAAVRHDRRQHGGAEAADGRGARALLGLRAERDRVDDPRQRQAGSAAGLRRWRRCRVARRVALVRGRARRGPAADPALRPRPRRPHRSSRRRLGPDERQQRLAVEAAGDRELIA